jgi:hypothetical protein
MEITKKKMVLEHVVVGRKAQNIKQVIGFLLLLKNWNFLFSTDNDSLLIIIMLRKSWTTSSGIAQRSYLLMRMMWPENLAKFITTMPLLTGNKVYYTW